MSKKLVRKKINERLKATSSEWLRIAQISLQQRLRAALNQFSNEQGGRQIPLLTFSSFFRGEPNFDGFAAFNETPYLPTSLISGELAFFRQGKKLIAGLYGVPEPEAKDDPLDLSCETVAYCLVPGVAFDRSGGRLGRGKGYYDRFLKDLGQNIYTIGVCWSWQLLDGVPTEPHDVQVRWICTEEEIFRTKAP